MIGTRFQITISPCRYYTPWDFSQASWDRPGGLGNHHHWPGNLHTGIIVVMFIINKWRKKEEKL